MGLSYGALQRFGLVLLTLRGLCADLVDNSTPRPSFPVAFHPQRADPQAAARLTSSTCTHPPPTNNPSPFKFSLVSPEKPTPRFCPNFPRAGRVEECEVHTSASFLARKQDCPFSGGSSPHTARQKGENAGKLKFRPQSNVSRSGQQWCAAFHFVCLSQAGGKGGC